MTKINQQKLILDFSLNVPILLQFWLDSVPFLSSEFESRLQQPTATTTKTTTSKQFASLAGSQNIFMAFCSVCGLLHLLLLLLLVLLMRLLLAAPLFRHIYCCCCCCM